MEINNHPNFLLAWSVSRMSVSITSASKSGPFGPMEIGARSMRQLLVLLFFDVFWLVESSEIAKWIKMIHDVLMMIFRESKINKNLIMLPSFWRFVMFGWFLPSSGPRGLRGSPCCQQDHVSRDGQQPKHHLVTWIWGYLGLHLADFYRDPCQSMPITPHRLGYNPFDYGILWPYT